MKNELNTMRNKKLVWGKISQGMVNVGYSSSVKKCRVKVDNLKQKYRKIRDGNKISGFGSFPCLSSRLKIKDGDNHGSYAIGHHFAFNFILRGYTAQIICFSVDVNRNIIE